MVTVLLNITIAFTAAMQLRLPNQTIIVYDKENVCNVLATISYDNFIFDAYTWKSEWS